MSFSGKKYRRKQCLNIKEMMKHSHASPEAIDVLLRSSAPVFSFIRLDENTFIFKLMLQEKVMSQRFRLGEEFEMYRQNGTKVSVTYTLEGDDVLNQVVKQPNGRVAHFRREFGTSNRMIITTSDMQEPAIVYYEVVE